MAESGQPKIAEIRGHSTPGRQFAAGLWTDWRRLGMASTSTRVGVGVVVRRADGSVLVGRRLAEPGQPLALPGGRLDPGETVEECAIRELGEETGLTLDAGAVRTFAAVLVDGWLVAGVEGRLAGEAEPQVREPDKFGAFAWIDAARPPEDLYPASAALLERL
jgi:8-oxo-dGTP diphosphatase